MELQPAFILQTQTARTQGLRRQFDPARATLAPLQPRLAAASVEAQVRYHLELGRTYASATHPPDNPAADRETARGHFMRAFSIAQSAALDNLAIDALHMMPSSGRHRCATTSATPGIWRATMTKRCDSTSFHWLPTNGRETRPKTLRRGHRHPAAPGTRAGRRGGARPVRV